MNNGFDTNFYNTMAYYFQKMTHATLKHIFYQKYKHINILFTGNFV